MLSFRCFVFVYLSHVTYITSQDIDCNNAYQCMGQTIYQPSSRVTGNGYKSIAGSNTSVIASDVVCNAAFSCSAISHIESTGSPAIINCRGGNACFDISEFISSTVYCEGSNSCKYCVIQSLDPSDNSNVHCNGDSSCTYSTIMGIDNVYGRGSYSLYNAIVHSPNTSSTFDISFIGFSAGYGATVICHSGDTCNIYCYLHGCFMTFVDCHDMSICNIHTYGAAVSPITNQSLFDKLTSLKDFSIENDQECNHPSTNTTYDNYYELGLSNVDELVSTTNYNICCRGIWACALINKIELSSSIKAKVICSGSDSCKESDIINNGPVFCDGYDSCSGQSPISNVINSTDNIYCFGVKSCALRHIYNARNVTCSGQQSCEESRISTMGLGGTYNIYLLGWWSGYNTNIECKANDECFILCGGQDACENTVLLCDGNCTVECDETSVCPEGANSTSVTIVAPRLPSFVAVTSNPTLSPTKTLSVLPNTTTAASHTTLNPFELSETTQMSYSQVNSSETAELSTLETRRTIGFNNSSVTDTDRPEDTTLPSFNRIPTKGSSISTHSVIFISFGSVFMCCFIIVAVCVCYQRRKKQRAQKLQLQIQDVPVACPVPVPKQRITDNKSNKKTLITTGQLQQTQQISTVKYGSEQNNSGNKCMVTMVTVEGVFDGIVGTSRCIQCGAVSEQMIEGEFVCVVCKQLDDKEADEAVDKMFDKNMSDTETTTGHETAY